MSLLTDIKTYATRLGTHNPIGNLGTTTFQLAEMDCLTPPILPPSALVGGLRTNPGGTNHSIFVCQSNAVGGSLVTELVSCENESGGAGAITRSFSYEFKTIGTPATFIADANTVTAQEFGGSGFTGTFLMGGVGPAYGDFGNPWIGRQIQGTRSIYVPTGQQLEILQVNASKNPSWCMIWQEFTVAL